MALRLNPSLFNFFLLIAVTIVMLISAARFMNKQLRENSVIDAAEAEE